jgi:hypothetical protein
MLSLPLVYNWPLHMGFYNYALSFALVGWVLGCWLRWREGVTVARWIGLTALTTVLYFCHPVSLIMAFAAILVMGAWLDYFDHREGRATPDAGRRRVAWLATFAPALIMAGAFLIRGQAGENADEPLVYFSFLKLRLLADLSLPLLSFRWAEIYAAWPWGVALIAGGVGVLVARGRARRFERADGLLFVMAVWTIVYLLAPAAAGGGTYIYQRLSIFPLLGCVLWVGAEPPDNPTLRRAVLGLAVCGILGLVAVHAAINARLDATLREYVRGAGPVERGQVILPISLTPQGILEGRRAYALRVQPFVHASGYVAMAHQAIDLSDYEGSLDYFPLRFRPALDPKLHGLNLEGDIEAISPLAWERSTGRRLDAVWIYDASGVLLGKMPAHFQEELAGSFTPQAAPDAGSSGVRVYRRRPEPNP